MSAHEEATFRISFRLWPLAHADRLPEDRPDGASWLLLHKPAADHDGARKLSGPIMKTKKHQDEGLPRLIATLGLDVNRAHISV